MMIAPAFLLTQVDHLGHDVCNPRFTLLDWSTSRRNRWSTSPEYADIAAFVAVQYLRSPQTKRLVTEAIEHQILLAARMISATPERARQSIETAQEDGIDLDGLTADELILTIREEGFRTKVNEAPFLRHVVETAEGFARILLSLDCEILRAPDGTGFLIGDHPFVVVPNAPEEVPGILAKGAIKYFPIDRKHCLRYGEPGVTWRRRKIDGRGVRTINQNVAANSHRYVMGPDRTQLEALVKGSMSTTMDATPRFRTTSLGDDINGGISMLEALPGRYFYPSP